MDNEQRLTDFFGLENCRDWEKYRTFLHPEIVWTLFSTEGQKKICGADAYMEKMQSSYHGSNCTFSCMQMLSSADKNRIVAILRNSVGDISIDVFDFKDGLIQKEYEYLL